MNARLWKRSAVAGSTLILTLAPFGVTSMAAVAATPNQTHTAVGSDNDFRQGFRAGFRGVTRMLGMTAGQVVAAKATKASAATTITPAATPVGTAADLPEQRIGIAR